MAIAMIVIGFGWALLGLGNIVAMFAKEGSTAIQAFGLLVNMVLFILPGLLIGGVGEMLRRRAANAPASSLAADRLPCPRCGESIAAAARACRFCGQSLDAQQLSVVTCPNCRAMYASSNNHCPGCFAEKPAQPAGR